MSKLSEIVSRRRSSGQSRTGALFGSLKDKIKETIDPRQLFNQTGILTALFPSLKAYKADSKQQKFNNTGAPSWLDVKPKNLQVENIEKNTEIFAKNSMYFSEIARDINVSRINVGKLVKLVSPAAAEKTDMYYKKTSEMEKSYESKFKSESKKSTRVDNKSKKSSFSWIKMIGLIGTVGVSYLLLDFIKNKEESIVKEIYDDLDEKFDSFKNNFLDFKEKTFIDFDKERIQLIDNLESQTDKMIDTVSKDFTFESIYDYIVDGTGPLKKYAESVSEFKGKLAEAATNVFPAAAASSLPVVTPKTDDRQSSRGLPSVPKSYGQSRGTGSAASVNNPSGLGARKEEDGSYTWRSYSSPSEGVADTQNLVGKYLSTPGRNTPETFVGTWVTGKGSEGSNVQGGRYVSSVKQELTKSGVQLNSDGTIPNTPQANAAITRAIINHETASKERGKFLPHVQEGDGNSSKNTTTTPFRITSRPGSRSSPFTGRGEYHPGYDIPAPLGTPIYSVFDGTVSFAGEMRGYGKTIKIDHENGTVSLYAHQSAFAEGITVGTKVNKSQLIGYVGSTGRSTGPHLHFELKKNGKSIGTTDDLVLSSVIKVSLEKSGLLDSLSRVAVMKNANRGKEVLIVNRETVSIQNQTGVASIANTDDKRLNLLIAAASGSSTG
jgi:murein DD-endopeptidase MepM/ murein hydrolase activator NlpD